MVNIGESWQIKETRHAVMIFLQLVASLQVVLGRKGDVSQFLCIHAPWSIFFPESKG